MKIERGIISLNNKQEMVVCMPGHIYHLNHEDFYKRSLKVGQKVLGVIINNHFNVYREFISNSGEFVFGFLIRDSKPGIIQAFPGFEISAYDPYKSDYIPGSYHRIFLP